MRVYVTGGAGFIGSGLVHALLAGGHDVAVLDDLSHGSPANLDPRAGFRKLDILDDEMATHMAEFRPDAVVHLAAQASVAASIEDPERDRLVNAEGTRRVAIAAREAGAARVILASSAAVYGTPAELPLTESSPCAPESPYGASKLEAESLLVDALAGSDVDPVILRFSNVYGPRQSGAGEGGVVAALLTRIAEGAVPVIHGDGRQTRDFIYVGNVVGALLTVLGCEEPLAQAGPVFNISTGQRRSILELMAAIRPVTMYFGPVEHGPAREGDIQDSVLDPSRAEQVLGWKATVELEHGISLTWPWFSAARAGR
jgi:UDP-glucose 4-epimerase